MIAAASCMSPVHQDSSCPLQHCYRLAAPGCWLSSSGCHGAEALQEARGPDPLLSLLSSTPRPRRKSDTSTRPGHLPPIMHRHPPAPLQPPTHPQVCCLTAQGVASCNEGPLQLPTRSEAGCLTAHSCTPASSSASVAMLLSCRHAPSHPLASRGHLPFSQPPS